MADIKCTSPEPGISKRREQVRREWSKAERQVRQLAATIAQQQLYLLINCNQRPMLSQ